MTQEVIVGIIVVACVAYTIHRLWRRLRTPTTGDVRCAGCPLASTCASAPCTAASSAGCPLASTCASATCTAASSATAAPCPHAAGPSAHKVTHPSSGECAERFRREVCPSPPTPSPRCK